ncbi:hypothetical protein ABK040_005243 [Willaertia magna]
MKSRREQREEKKASVEEKTKKITKFQQRVFDALLLIPKGKVTTYKYLSDYLNCNSCQAIGQALKKNPFSPQIPCHRVIKSDYSLGGFNGKTEGSEIERKKKLLGKEGINFDDNLKLLNIPSEVLFDFKTKN